MELENYGGCKNCTKRKVCSKCREMCEVLEEINNIFCEEINVEGDIVVNVKCSHFEFDYSLLEEEKPKKGRKKRGEEDE